jgi:hypothetical protein
MNNERHQSASDVIRSLGSVIWGLVILSSGHVQWAVGGPSKELEVKALPMAIQTEDNSRRYCQQLKYNLLALPVSHRLVSVWSMRHYLGSFQIRHLALVR